MRLIDADEYEKRIKPYDTEDVMDKALYNFAHGKLIETSTADLSEYCDKLWKIAYERGRKEATAEKKGKWIRPLGSPRCSYRYQCSECGEVAYQVTGNCGRKVKVPEPCCSYRYCPNCGARMEENDETDRC